LIEKRLPLAFALLLSGCSAQPAVTPHKIVSDNPCVDAILAAEVRASNEARISASHVKSPQATSRNRRRKFQCTRQLLTWVRPGFGGPSVAHSAKPSRITTAANRTENPLTPYLKINFRDNAKKLTPDYAEFMNARRGCGLLLAQPQRSFRM